MPYYEKLDVYQCSIQFLAIATAIIEKLDRKNAALKDQLYRASISVPLNIAESTGKTSPTDKARFFAIARGSAMECGACLDCLRIIQPNCTTSIKEGKVLIERIVEMLSKMCRKA